MLSRKDKRTAQAYRDELARLRQSLERAQSAEDENWLNIEIDRVRHRLRQLEGK